MKSDKEIEKIRDNIDDIDQKIIKLIEKRVIQAIKISKVKQKLDKNKNFYNPEREAQLLKKIFNSYEGKASKDGIIRIFREIMSLCLSLESPIKVGYLGPEGTYTHSALKRHFGSSAIDMSLPSIPKVFESVNRNECNYGIVPIENSTEGVVTSTLDMFLNHDVLIIGEVEIKVSHNVLSNCSKISDINKIYAHPQSFAQCSQWIDTNFKNIPLVNTSSNAEAAKFVQKEKDAACIASKEASEIYKLKVLSSNIQDNLNNATRFLIIGKKITGSSGDDKTSILVSAKNEPGSLYKLLSPLSKNNVSMTKIESRPSKHNNWEYIFYLDIDGHISQKKLKDATKNIEKLSSFYKFLGSYPKAIK